MHKLVTFVILFFRVKIVASCDMLLEDFPMDTQQCFLTLGSCRFIYTNENSLDLVFVCLFFVFVFTERMSIRGR